MKITFFSIFLPKTPSTHPTSLKQIMPKSIEESTASGSVTHIGNKIKRQEVYRKHAKDKAKAKLEKRIKRAQEEKEEGGKEKKRVSTDG